MDLLNSCRLLNYWGKADKVGRCALACVRVCVLLLLLYAPCSAVSTSKQVDEVVNYPILATKGKTKLALYGMGNIRDERLHRTFQNGQVKW